MSTFRKNLVLFSLMFSIASVSAPKKADAGIVLVSTPYAAVVTLGTVVIFVGGVATIVGGLSEISDCGGPDGINWLLWGGIGVLVLDADGALPQEQLQQKLQEKYTFTQNSKFFGSLAAYIKAKADITPIKEGKKMISVPREVFSEKLAAIDVSGHEAEAEQMAKDLE